MPPPPPLAELFPPPPAPPEHKSSVELPDEEESIDELDNSEMFDGFDGDIKLIMFMQLLLLLFELGTCWSMVLKPLLLLLDNEDEDAEVDDTNDWDFSARDDNSDDVAGTSEIRDGPLPTSTPSKLFDCFRFC